MTIKRHIPAVAAAALSAALLVAAFPPFGETAAIAVAIAPLLVVARMASPKKAAWTWFGGGFAFWFATLGWMPAICKNDGPWPLVGLGWFGLAALCAGYFALFGWLDARAWRRFGRWGLAFEPILWSGVEWLRGIREICDQHGILMIVDDIQVGNGRSGYFFSFERAGIVPDIVTMSKSIGGYGLPLAITLIKPELDIWKPGEHNGTFRGNQLAFVAAKAGIEYALGNKVYEQAMAKGEVVKRFIEDRILPLDSRLECRGLGLIWGIEFENIPVDGLADKVIERCFEHGLIIEGAGRKNSVVKLMPPLVIETDELLEGLNIIEKAVKEELEKI